MFSEGLQINRPGWNNSGESYDMHDASQVISLKEKYTGFLGAKEAQEECMWDLIPSL